MDNTEAFLRVLEEFPEQVREAARLWRGIRLKPFETIVICGMGGSGLPGEIVRSVVKDVPVILVKDYTLPWFVDEKTLVFAVSYSGNTEETIELYNQAKKKHAQIVVVASGGELAALAMKDELPLVLVPSGLQPRMAFAYQTIPLLNILKVGCDWNRCAGFLEQERDEVKKLAHELAQLIGKRIPLIYSSAHFFPAAYKWKINFNENAKMHAFCNSFPEWNHNEINGYDSLNGHYLAFFLVDSDDHSRIAKRMTIVRKITEAKGVPVVSVNSKGTDFITRLFWTIWLGDLVSYYFAVSHGVDPLNVPVIEDLKKELKK